MMRWQRLMIVGIAGLAAVFPAAAAGRPTLDRTEISDLFSQGKQLFHQANELANKDPAQARELYHKAAMRFERIVREGRVHSGKLYYNIGNAYFRMQDLGRAILNYRRAERLMPDDVNLRQNLAFAQTKCTDKIPEKQETKVLRTLFFWHYDLSTPTRTTAFMIFFPALWGFAIVRLFVNRPLVNWGLVASAALAAVLLGSLAVEAWTGARNRPGVVVAPEVVARKGDGETYQPSFSEPLHAGTEFNLREDRGQWVHVELADGRTCWLPSKSVELVHQ